MSIKTQYLQSVGEYFHVYNRGVNRERIFFEERNYTYFLRRMRESVESSAVTVIAYCLMPNHFHLLLRQEEQYALSDFMKGVCDGYAKAINNARKRSGHLFEGKYKLKHVTDEKYLIHITRYIHMNPVRAQLVRLRPGSTAVACAILV